MISPSRSCWRMEPGNGPVSPTEPAPFALKWVTKRLSPASSLRFSPPPKPPGISTSMAMSPEMNVIAPASDVSCSPAWSATTTAGACPSRIWASTPRSYAPGMAEAVVVGSGPNGLAAAIELAQAGLSVRVLEAAETVGGGTRSAELTLPGFVHDVCSAIHPLGFASPFLRSLPLEAHGLEWVEPPAALAHPFDDGTAVLLEPSPEATAPTLGEDDARWRRLFAPLARDADSLLEEILAPLHVPAHPVTLARFGLRALLPATTVARRSFHGAKARGLFAGLAAHSMLPLERPPSAAFGLMLGLLGHAVGWPFPRGGSQAIADALASYLRSLGGDRKSTRLNSSHMSISYAVFCLKKKKKKKKEKNSMKKRETADGISYR